jgi:26S proteasome non-ATPase regulatory subunit 9
MVSITAAACAGSVSALKAELQAKQAQREALETEIQTCLARLNAPGQPGLKGSLLDKEARVT